MHWELGAPATLLRPSVLALAQCVLFEPWCFICSRGGKGIVSVSQAPTVFQVLWVGPGICEPKGVFV